MDTFIPIRILQSDHLKDRRDKNDFTDKTFKENFL